MRPHHSSNTYLSGYPPPPHHGQLGPRHGSMPYEGSSNGYPPASSSRYPSGSNSYYYSSSARPQPLGNNSAAPSPSAHSYRTNVSADHPPMQHHSTSTMPGRRGGSVGPSPHYDAEPSYHVEHLATFAVGRQFGLLSPQDGIRKLKQMEKQSAIWAQPLLLKLKPDKVSVEDENGDIVEQFPMELIVEPTAHQTHDNMDTYNNILLFIVKEDPRSNKKFQGNPTEMHIFQCVRVSAVDVAQDMMYYSHGQHQKVRGGRRDTGYGGSVDASPYGPVPAQNYYRDDASPSSHSSEAIDMNVNTLNRCFDDIERFVARIQSAAMAQREIEMQKIRMRSAKPRGKNEQIPGILQLRAQIPQPAEFYEILQKFKLSINILTLVQNYIHDPNAPELLHFLFTPLRVIVDACNWGLGQNIALKVVSPLLSFEAKELLKSCLTPAEFDLWMSLGNYWRLSPEEWDGPPPPPYRPVFRDNFAPYGYPQQGPQNGRQLPPNQMHRGSSAPPTQSYPPPSRTNSRPVDDLDIDRERERLAFERMKISDRERRLMEEEQRLRKEEARILAERELLRKEAVQVRPGNNTFMIASQPSPKSRQGGNAQMHAFLTDLNKHGRKIVEVLYDRVKQHEKELTVVRGEYLEVLNDEKNWWECRNSQNNVGFVPHTILSVLTPEDVMIILKTSNGYGDVSPVGPPTQVPPPPPASALQNGTSTATRSMIEAIQSVVLRRSNEKSSVDTPMGTTKKLPTPQLPYMDDLYSTINSKTAIIRRKLSNRGKMINKNSSNAEVQAWFNEKDFSKRVKTLFADFGGADMFSLDRETLIKHCGEEEGKHLYSLLLVQKRRSNFDSFSKSDPALQAILHMRREQTDKKNEASAEPDEEPPLPAGSAKAKPNTIVPKSVSQDSGAPRKLTPPSKKVVPKQNGVIPSQQPKKIAPTAAPRTTAAPYQPARLASPPNQPARRDSWIQTVKRYN